MKYHYISFRCGKHSTFHSQNSQQKSVPDLHGVTVAFLALKKWFFWKKNSSKKKTKFFLPFFNATFQCGCYNIFKKNIYLFFAHENLKKRASKVFSYYKYVCLLICGAIYFDFLSICFSVVTILPSLSEAICVCTSLFTYMHTFYIGTYMQDIMYHVGPYM